MPGEIKVGDQPVLALYAGDKPALAMYEGTELISLGAAGVDEFQNVQVSSNLAQNFTSPSSGGARMFPVDNGSGGRMFAKTVVNEIPIRGGLRRRNLLTDLNIAGWNKIRSGAEAVAPVLTNNYVNDPVYGQCARIQLNAGSTGAAGNYSWVYKLLTTGLTARRRSSVSCPMKLTAPATDQDSFPGNGVQTVFTLSHWITTAGVAHITVKRNGVVLEPGGIDFLLSGKTLTLNTALLVGQTLTVDYRCRSLGLSRGLLGTGVVNVPNDWELLQLFFDIPTGANADYGIGMLVNRGGILDAAIDFLIPMNTLYGPVIETVTDNVLPRPQIDGSTDYGWGADGVKAALGPKTYPLSFGFDGVTRFDDFHRANNSAGDGLGVGPQGQVYEDWRSFILEAGLYGQIKNNRYHMDPPASTPQIADYEMNTVAGRVKRIGCIVNYQENTGINQGPWGFVWALLVCQTRNRFTDNMIHFIGTHLSWTLEIWRPDGSKKILRTGNFSPPLTYSATKNWIIDLKLDGDIATVVMPSNSFAVQDAELEAFEDARYIIIEQYANGPTANIQDYVAFYSEIEGETALTADVFEAYEPLVFVPEFRPAPDKTETITYSTDLSNAAWTKTGLGTVAELGTDAQKIEGERVWRLQEDASTGLHVVSQATGIGAAQQTVAAITAPRERAFVYVDLYNATDGIIAHAIVEMATGEVTDGAAVVDRQLGDQACIISLTGTPTVAGTVLRFGPALNGTTSSYAGTAGNGIVAYYGGAETGPRFTGPIVTAGASVARSADEPNAGPILAAADWTVYMEITVPPEGAMASEILLGSASKFPLMVAGDGLHLQSFNGSGYLFGATQLLTPGKHRLIVRNSGANGAMFIDGVKEADAAYDFGIGPTDDVGIGSSPLGGGGGRVILNRVRRYDYAVDDTLCAALTAV